MPNEKSIGRTVFELEIRGSKVHFNDVGELAKGIELLIDALGDAYNVDQFASRGLAPEENWCITHSGSMTMRRMTFPSRPSKQKRLRA